MLLKLSWSIYPVSNHRTSGFNSWFHSLSGGQTIRLGLSEAQGTLPVGCNTGLVVVCESHSVWKEGSGSSICHTGESLTEWILQEIMVRDLSTLLREQR